MTGDWELLQPDAPLPRFTRATIVLDDAGRVALVDPRALGTLALTEPGASTLPPLGPEPLDPSFGGESLRVALVRRRGPIKPALLDQRVVAGVGNIYAAEALWEAKISPRAASNSLGRERLDRLARAIVRVLRRAPAARYTDDARTARWRVYDREGKACQRCGAHIRRMAQAGRSTYYCPRCQRR
jgi:formamidopyrimidine-DNA glycosylase